MKNRTTWKNSTNKNLIWEIEKIKLWFEHFKWRKEEMAESFKRAFKSKKWSKNIKIGKLENFWKFRSLKKWNYRICTYYVHNFVSAIWNCPFSEIIMYFSHKTLRDRKNCECQIAWRRWRGYYYCFKENSYVWDRYDFYECRHIGIKECAILCAPIVITLRKTLFKWTPL